MNNIKPPQVVSPPPVNKSSATVKPPQVIKQSIEEKLPPPPPPSHPQPKSKSKPQKSGKGSEWTVVVLVILAVLAVVAVVVFFIAKDKKPTPAPLPITEPWHPITPESISLNKDSLRFENTGASEQLNATVFPADVSEKNKEVIWQSGNETVATVDTNGVVTAITNGNAVITAYTLNGLPATCHVTVGSSGLSENINPVVKSPVVEPPKKNEPVKPSELEIKKVPYTPAQLNNLLNKIKKSDDNAIDEIRKVLGNNMRVEGAANISNVQQLITDVSNGSNYKVTKVNTDANGKVISISVSK